MNAQDFLTYTFDVLALGYGTLMVLDLIDRLGGELWEIFWPEKNITSKEEDMPRMPKVSPGQLSLFDIQPEPLPQLPDPWTLPDLDVVEFIALSQLHKPAQPEQKPLLLLPQALEISTQPPLPTTTEPTRDELLAGVDLDNLQLRPARKLAKLMNISQKVNGKDKPLSFLRAQIKTKLQQPQELPAEALEAVRRELLAG